MSGSPTTIHERGREALLAGRELPDQPPAPGGSRWGLSVVFRPDDAAAERLAVLAEQAAASAGPGHWLTGSRGSSHLTVTYLEPVHRVVEGDDPAVRTYVDLVGRVAAQTPPLRWQLSGVALADRGVLALAEPADDGPDRFRATILRELGDLGQAEASYRRSVWWSTLLHFAAPVADRAALARWADARVAEPAGPVVGRAVDVVRYEYDGRQVRPVTLASAALTGVPEEVRDGAQA